jgi:hypothetical protein
LVLFYHGSQFDSGVVSHVLAVVARILWVDLFLDLQRVNYSSLSWDAKERGDTLLLDAVGRVRVP